jgi:EpsD family peptidyl-prolyl cis-trans isomerase
MRAFFLTGLLVGTSLLLSACNNGSGNKDKPAKGQVIATVNGNDVTVYELGTELQGMNLPAGAERKKVEQAALQRIVDRKILADIARDKKLDKTPEYLLQTRRSDEQILVNLLQQSEAAKVPGSTSEDVEKFMAANPWAFAQRKLLIIDQIQFPMPADRKALMAYRPLKTLDEVEQKLVTDGIEYRRVPTSLDTAQMNATMAKSILGLPTGEVFVVPAGGGLTASRIVDIRATPLSGPEAMKIAREMLRRQNMAEKARTELEPLLTAARAKVTYKSGYSPTPVKADKAGAETTSK